MGAGKPHLLVKMCISFFLFSAEGMVQWITLSLSYARKKECSPKNLAHFALVPTPPVAALEKWIDGPSQPQLFCIFRQEIMTFLTFCNLSERRKKA